MAAAREKARPRWFRIAPDRCVVTLLALEGFLLLSAWFCWFPFNQHKGWTVLVTIASVGVALLLMLLWFLAALVFRWRFQFSIRSLLLLVVVVAVPCSWLATEMKQARKQREVVEEIEVAGGDVIYDYQFNPYGADHSDAEPPGPAWLRTLVGDDLFMAVMKVQFGSPSEPAAAMERPKGLPQLQTLNLAYTSPTDADLAHLNGLTQLRRLDLRDTRVSDESIKKLQQALPSCTIRH